eukprot:scaffold9350_cov105-Isochrysis_galbana.AAC.3
MTANTVATSTLVKLARAESVEAGGSRWRWRAHPAPSPHPVMKSASLRGRARCGCRSVRGNVGVGTSPSAGPRALQPGGQRARVAPRRAPLLWKLLGAARPAFPSQDGPAGAAGAARFAAARAERRGSWHMVAAVGRGAAAAPSRTRLCRQSRRPGARSARPHCLALRPRSPACPLAGFSTDPEPATPYPCRVGCSVPHTPGADAPHAAAARAYGCGARAVLFGWRVATVANGNISAAGEAGGGDAHILGVVSGWPRGWRRVEAAATPPDPGWTSGCWWEPSDGISARFIPAGSWRRWLMATSALLEAGRSVFEAW